MARESVGRPHVLWISKYIYFFLKATVYRTQQAGACRHMADAHAGDGEGGGDMDTRSGKVKAGVGVWLRKCSTE
jgi:hypothetical protein